MAPAWYDTFSQVPEGPLILIANEFFDALPIRQFEKTPPGWSERLVDWDDEGEGLRLVLSPPATEMPLGATDRKAAVGEVFEICPAGIGLAGAIAERVARFGGAALIIDYGDAGDTSHGTLQSVRDHAYHSLLADPGEADLTAHVDFAALARAAVEAGAAVYGPLTQGELLRRLGIDARAEALAAHAAPEQAEEIGAALRRLVDADAMGELFKAIAIAHPDMVVPPGFE
jgi:NADH dehydrogenase [ubiquinone] 1 alpha subcomplex assembly factor 7